MLTVAAALLWPPASGRSQEATPDVASRVLAIHRALAAVSEAARAGGWQQADYAYNAVLGALDEHRSAIEVVRGAPAAAAFTAIDDFLLELDDALAAEDAVRVEAIIGFCQARLAELEPGLAVEGPPEEATTTVLRWRSAVDGIVQLAAAGAWRDARNAAIDFLADVRRRGGLVARTAGEGGELAVAEVRVFAQRLRYAALEQSLAAIQAAAEIEQGALERLLSGLGVAPGPTTQPTHPEGESRVRLVALPEGDAGRFSAMLLLQGIPHPGLGHCRLRLRWSPSALRLIGVDWALGAGTTWRDDANGMVELELPPAPLGPTGDILLARLGFEVVGPMVDPRYYLPVDEVTELEGALADAQSAIRHGDSPEAGRRLAEAYRAFAQGRGRPASLYSRLAAVQRAEELALHWLATLEAVSEPAATDVVVASLGTTRQALHQAMSDYLASFAPKNTVPVMVDVVAATDTSGAPLALARPEHASIPLAGIRPAVATGVMITPRSQRAATVARPTVPVPGASRSPRETPTAASAPSLSKGLTEGLDPTGLVVPLATLLIAVALGSMAAASASPRANQDATVHGGTERPDMDALDEVGAP